MAGFCGSCGTPLSEQSGFCGGCGARAGQQPAAAPVAKSPGGGGGSALKVVLIVVGGLFVLGSVSLGGMYYVAHRYVTMAEDLTGVKAGDVVQLKSGGPKMTIARLENVGGVENAVCGWFSGDKKSKKEISTFPLTMLTQAAV